ncbi:MAG: class I SAM-dependent methyltransferase, partial [Actinomycetota bacterium]
MSDYDKRAEFHEVFMPPVWDRLQTLVRNAFGSVGPDGVIVDIGAGSGLGATKVAGVTDAEIIALEPNMTMRAMLVARLDTAGVLDRVTVLPGSVPDALDDLPDRVHGVIAAHMLGHLDRRDRAGLLQWIAGSLVPGCSALLTVSPEVAAADDKPAIEERTVGRLHYRVTHLPADHGRYDGLFEVLDREHRVVRSLPDSGSWQAV